MDRSPRSAISRPVLGIIMASASYFGFSILDTSFKVVEVTSAVAVLIWFRFFVHGVITAITSLFLDRSWWRTKALKIHLWRSFFIMSTTTCNFIALQYLPLSTTAALFFCSPLVSCVLAPWLLKEHVGIRRWTAVIFGLIGVLVIVRPISPDFHWSIIVSFGSAIGFSFYTLLTRKAAIQDSDITNFLYTPWVGIIAMLPFALADWRIPEETWAIGVMLSLGVIGCISHILYVLALKYAEASLLAPLQYQQMIYMVTLGWIFFEHWPDRYVIIGSCLIILSGVYVLFRSDRKQKQKLAQGS